MCVTVSLCQHFRAKGHAAVMVKGEETLASCALSLEASAQNTTLDRTQQSCDNEPGNLTLPKGGVCRRGSEPPMKSNLICLNKQYSL